MKLVLWCRGIGDKMHVRSRRRRARLASGQCQPTQRTASRLCQKYNLNCGKGRGGSRTALPHVARRGTLPPAYRLCSNSQWRILQPTPLVEYCSPVLHGGRQRNYRARMLRPLGGWSSPVLLTVACIIEVYCFSGARKFCI